MKKPVIIKHSHTTRVIAGVPGIQKSVTVHVPPVVTQLPAHERAARRHRLVTERPAAPLKPK